MIWPADGGSKAGHEQKLLDAADQGDYRVREWEDEETDHIRHEDEAWNKGRAAELNKYLTKGQGSDIKKHREKKTKVQGLNTRKLGMKKPKHTPETI